MDGEQALAKGWELMKGIDQLSPAQFKSFCEYYPDFGEIIKKMDDHEDLSPEQYEEVAAASKAGDMNTLVRVLGMPREDIIKLGTVVAKASRDPVWTPLLVTKSQ